MRYLILPQRYGSEVKFQALLSLKPKSQNQPLNYWGFGESKELDLFISCLNEFPVLGFTIWFLSLRELFKLHLVQLEIKTFPFNQFIMGAHFNNFSFIQHNDFICLPYGRQTMSDYNRSAVCN